MYELQLFDDAIGQYVPVETGDDPESLMSQARGMARRVINAESYNKPLPLKPRIPYGLSGKPRKYRKDTMICPASLNELVNRAHKHYKQRAASGEKDIKVYVWKDSKFAQHMHIYKAKPEIYQVIELDPDEYL